MQSGEVDRLRQPTPPVRRIAADRLDQADPVLVVVPDERGRDEGAVRALDHPVELRPVGQVLITAAKHSSVTFDGARSDHAARCPAARFATSSGRTDRKVKPSGTTGVPRSPVSDRRWWVKNGNSSSGRKPAASRRRYEVRLVGQDAAGQSVGFAVSWNQARTSVTNSGRAGSTTSDRCSESSIQPQATTWPSSSHRAVCQVSCRPSIEVRSQARSPMCRRDRSLQVRWTSSCIALRSSGPA